MVIDEETFTQQILNIIRTRRQELGISQKALAEIIGRDTSGAQWIGKIENGKRSKLPIQTVFIIMKALRINIKFELEDIE